VACAGAVNGYYADQQEARLRQELTVPVFRSAVMAKPANCMPQHQTFAKQFFGFSTLLPNAEIHWSSVQEFDKMASIYRHTGTPGA